MKPAAHTLARRYACAYLNIFDASLTQEQLIALCRVADFLQDRTTSLALGVAPYLDQNHVIDALADVCIATGAPQSIKKLIALLVQARRLELLAEVFVSVCEQYKARHGIIACSITSSHELAEKERQLVHQFIERRTQRIVQAQHSVDGSLIAGIRVVANNFFWEYSVRRYLADIRTSLLR